MNLDRASQETAGAKNECKKQALTKTRTLNIRYPFGRCNSLLIQEKNKTKNRQDKP